MGALPEDLVVKGAARPVRDEHQVGGVSGRRPKCTRLDDVTNGALRCLEVVMVSPYLSSLALSLRAR